MKPINKKELIEWFKTFKKENLFCPHCCSKLEYTDEDKYYCPNEMCLNEEEYKNE